MNAPGALEIPISNPNRQSFNEECRRFANFTDAFIAKYGNCLYRNELSGNANTNIAHVMLSNEGEFVEVAHVSAKSRDPSPNHVFLDLDRTDDRLSWRIDGTVDDPYEVIFDEEGGIEVVTHETDTQGSLIRSRVCDTEEAKMIFAVVRDICSSPIVKAKLAQFSPRAQSAKQAQIDGLEGSKRQVKDAVKSLKSRLRMPQGNIRSRIYERSKLSGRSLR